jgi:sugar phosphate isomerase/epimerase
LHALHVHDNDYIDDRHTLPGLGRMDWEEIMKALAEIDYDGDFTYEADNFLVNIPRE